LSFFLITCGGGGGGGSAPTEPTGPTYVIELSSLSGQAQKGPFNNGTAINIAELTNTLSPTGRNFSSQIINNSGLFSVTNVQLTSPYVELRANGFYFNEVSNQASDAQLTLYALSDLTNKTSINVNILSHLEKNRIATLMSGSNPKTFSDAKLQAQGEILTIFDLYASGMPESELLDISKAGSGNAKLLAISAILQGDLTVAQMSELLANVSTDITTDGILNDTAIQSILLNNAAGLDLNQIRNNLVDRYNTLGIEATISDFESQVEHFLKRPIADDMSVSTDQATPIDITLTATDPDNESLTFTISQNPSSGSIALEGDVATYTPNPRFSGAVYFLYYASDGNSNSNDARVDIEVADVNWPPTAISDTLSIYQGTVTDFELSGFDYDDDNLTYHLVSQPLNGTAELYNINHVIYTPNGSFYGEDSLTFQANDGEYDSALATIIINVKEVTSYGNSDGTSIFYALEKTSDGNLIAGGWRSIYDGPSGGVLVKYDTSGNIIWEIPVTDQRFTSIRKIRHTSDDGFILVWGDGFYKTDSNGNLEWEYDSPSNKNVKDATQTSDGNFVYISEGSNDIHMTKINSNGTELWSKTFGSNENERAFVVIEMSNGDLAMGASTRGFGAVDEDFYVVKTDSNGETIFQRIWGTGGSDEVYDMYENSNGNIILTGHYSNGFSIYIAEMDSNSNIVWQATPYGAKTHGVKVIKPTLDGGFIVVGSEDTTNPYMQYDILVVKADGSGNFEWSRLFGLGNSPSQNDYGLAVACLDDGSYVIAGETTSYGDVINSEGNYAPNAILIFLDSNGNELRGEN